jgi:Leucine-rich repeat (LRR) protein
LPVIRHRFLRLFGQLRRLSLLVQDSTHYEDWYKAWKALEAVPSTLDWLELKLIGSPLLGAIPSTLQQKAPLLTTLLLHHAVVGSAEEAASIPHTVTNLRVQKWSPAVRLPPNVLSFQTHWLKIYTYKSVEWLFTGRRSKLLHLRIGSCMELSENQLFFASLPKKLQTLTINAMDIDPWTKPLPKSLTELQTSFPKPSPSGFEFSRCLTRLSACVALTGYSSLPNTLTDLTLQDGGVARPSMADVAKLPPSLIFLTILSSRSYGCHESDPPLPFLRLKKWDSPCFDLSTSASHMKELGKNKDLVFFGTPIMRSGVEGTLEHIPTTLTQLKVYRGYGCIRINLERWLDYIPRRLREWNLEVSEEIVASMEKRNFAFPPIVNSLFLRVNNSIGLTDSRMHTLLSQNRSLVTLRCNSSQITDEGIKFLPPNLTHLDLSRAPVTSDCFKDLPRSLEFLSLANCNQIARPPKQFSDLPKNLTSLTVGASSLSSAHVRFIPARKSLKYVHFCLNHCIRREEALHLLPKNIIDGGVFKSRRYNYPPYSQYKDD